MICVSGGKSMFCKYCGNEVAENTKFCTKCGKPIVNEAVQNKVHTT